VEADHLGVAFGQDELDQAVAVGPAWAAFAGDAERLGVCPRQRPSSVGGRAALGRTLFDGCDSAWRPWSSRTHVRVYPERFGLKRPAPWGGRAGGGCGREGGG